MTRHHDSRRRRCRDLTAGLAAVGGGALLGVTLLAGCGNGSSAQPAWVTQSPGVGSSASAAAPTASSTDSPGTASAQASAAATPSDATSTPPTEGNASDVQRELDQMNYSVASTGKYDSATRAALKKFQAKHGLPQTGLDDAATQAALNQALATFQATATRTDSAGFVFDGAYWSAGGGDYYRSRNRECVVHEQEWQAAVAAGVKSDSVNAHDAAAKLGCNPDSWTPNTINHPVVQEKHTDGQKCTSDEEGTIAKGGYPWAVCNQVSDGVWRWKTMGS